VGEPVPEALFVYDPEAAELVEKISSIDTPTSVRSLPIAEFLAAPAEHPSPHLVVAAPLALIKQLLGLAKEHEFSLGIVPMADQARLRRYLNLPKKDEDAIELALQAEPKPMDLVLCNGEILLFRAVIGWLPVLDALDELGPWELLKQAFRRGRRLRLYPYRFKTANDRQVRTACTGCMIVERHEASPFSMVEYLRFIYQLFFSLRKKSGLPGAVSYLQSRSFDIDSDKEKEVYIDGELATTTPVKVETLPAAVRVNLGPALAEADSSGDPDKETIRVGNLREEKELARSIGSNVPFFSYASEERFRDLFTALNEDANIHTHYVVFLLLSTFIATLGLYLSSAAVIIGAMVLAPLMAPLVSISMALLRADDKLFWRSLETIALGIALVLGAAALTSLIFPHQPITGEMESRLHPSLPDLFVAIFSGVAAAYARSYKEIARSLAGVAIAVALVPPLAVAGIGLGRGDPVFFSQSFLLFTTNLVGIVLAATLTFRVLGFSAALHGKRRFGAVALMLLLIAIPLVISSVQISKHWEAEQMLERDQYHINGKKVVISDVEVGAVQNESGLLVTIAASEPLNRADLVELERLIRSQLRDDFALRLDVHYVL
jgi:uncharacterized hydrophobic protein (TIGR00271 family)